MGLLLYVLSMKSTPSLLRQLIRENISRPKIYVLVGPPGVGKSWWVRDNVVDPYIISRDDIVDAVRLPHGLKYNEMFGPKGKHLAKDIDARFNERVRGAANSGHDIVVDMTNMGVSSRKNALKAISGREKEYEKIAVFFDYRGSEDKVQRSVNLRAAELDDKNLSPAIIQGMFNRLEIPTREEGFDDIIVVDPSDALNRP